MKHTRKQLCQTITANRTDGSRVGVKDHYMFEFELQRTNDSCILVNKAAGAFS